MRVQHSMATVTVILLLLALITNARTQSPEGDNGSKNKNAQGAVDEEKEILKEIKEAYKAPYEVHKDVLSELRKAYRQPTSARQDKIIKELRRLYLLTPQQEEVILREVRRAFEKQTPEQEERIFQYVDQVERLPNGMVPPTVQEAQAKKIFQRLDLNGDDRLTGEEIPTGLRRQRGRWDANRDGAIDVREYWLYYLGRLDDLSEQVAAGQIELFPNRTGVALDDPSQEDEPRPVVYRPGKLPDGLPDWFVKLDTDNDAQLGLYEWKKSGRPLREFLAMDRNGDGFVTVDEVLRYLETSPNLANSPSRIPSTGSSDRR